MARLVPEEPTFQTVSEHETWERLRSTLPGDAVLLANQRLTDETLDHEADLVVLLPGVGVVVLEIKGSSVWHDETGWWIQRRGRPTRIEPVEQVRRTKFGATNSAHVSRSW